MYVWSNAALMTTPTEITVTANTATDYVAAGTEIVLYDITPAPMLSLRQRSIPEWQKIAQRKGPYRTNSRKGKK